jgi:thiol-disulfide isomerase/thioredoxin
VTRWLQALWLGGLLAAGIQGGFLSRAVAANDNAGKSNAVSQVPQAANAAAAWAELSRSSKAPADPPEWKNTPPTVQAKHAFYLPYVLAAVDKAKNFRDRFPSDEHAPGAQLMEFQLTLTAYQWGSPNQQSRLENTGFALLDSTNISLDQHHQILWILANVTAPEKARPCLQEIVNSTVDPSMRASAAAIFKRLPAAGKPLDWQFTAVDGSNVDFAKLRGKVVLVDFWATWCPVCVREIPDVKTVYDRFHGQGMEIVGINLDDDKARMIQFTTDNKMDWPQCLDRARGTNSYARHYKIEGIPAMWLVDKKGFVRDVAADEDLASQLQKLLAE